MTGDAEFNEVFFSEVRIPDSYRLGESGAGWSVAITTLMNERVSLGNAMATMATPAGSRVKLYHDPAATTTRR